MGRGYGDGYDKGPILASNISLVTTAFTGNLSAADTNVQLALATIDALSIGGSSSTPTDMLLTTTIANSAYSGIRAEVLVSQNVQFGDIVALTSGNKWALANALNTTSMPATAIALESIASGATGDALLFGFIRSDAWAFTAGAVVYASSAGTTLNTLTGTAPNSSGNQVQAVAKAVNTNILEFRPSLTLVEVA